VAQTDDDSLATEDFRRIKKAVRKTNCEA